MTLDGTPGLPISDGKLSIYIKEPAEKRLLVMHIIEQMGGASRSLMQFLLLAKHTNRQAVLPGIAEWDVLDRTIYRAFERESVKDLEKFLEVSAVSDREPQWPHVGFREHLAEVGPALDAVLIFVMNPKARPHFRPLVNQSSGAVMVNCSWLWEDCQSNKGHGCGHWFMTSIQDFRGIETWTLSPNAPVWCVHHNMNYWNETLSVWLQRTLHWANYVAILNWVGVVPWPCSNPNRICSSLLDSHGNATDIEYYVLDNMSLSPTVLGLADAFLARHPTLKQPYNAVQMRAEMLLARRYLSPICGDHGASKWFETLRSTMSSWSGVWFRARDLKAGGSATLVKYDAKCMEDLVKMEGEFWESDRATWKPLWLRSYTIFYHLILALLWLFQVFSFWGSDFLIFW